MSANPYMALLHRVAPPLMPAYRKPLMLILSKALYQIEFKHYSEPKLLTAGGDNA
jgi:hypothetical protein